MKRGKDEGHKTIEPMFPRLHVNDIEKGWPKAPPRNKMALYQQLSLPSSSQGTGTDGNLLLPTNLSPPTPTNQVGKSQPLPSDGINVNPLEQTTELGDGDDFLVPVYTQSMIGKNEVHNSDHMGKCTSPGVKRFDCSTLLQTSYDKGQVHFASSNAHLRSEITNRHKVSVDNRIHSAKSSKDLTRENIEGLQKEANVSANQIFLDKSNMTFNKSRVSDVYVQQHSRSSVQLDESGFVDDVLESTRDGEVDNVPYSRGDSHAMKKFRKLIVPADNFGNNVNRTYNSIQVENADQCDTVSENSMVDSISGLDVCPDDIVGIIGQKHFWKARRAIINQQRVFKVQVFELHRLLKVQQLIAESPHLLLEDAVCLDNSSPRPLPAKKLRSDYNVKSHVHLKHSDGPKKPNQNVECSAENAVEKTLIPSVPIGGQPSTNGPFSGNPQPTPVAADKKFSSWCPTSAHHSLVPVMSPSEGLIYKPFPATTGFICGGYGPYGSIMNPPHGFPIPTSVHQGIGSLPSTSMVGGSNFPTFGMPVMNNPGVSGLAVDQLSWYTGQTNPLSGGVAASSNIPQTIYDISMQRNENHETVPQTHEVQASKENELLASTASSPAVKVQANRTNRITESRDVLPLFPVALPLVEEGPQPVQKKRVIRVVPHNRRSATESAARIFQSIQNERKEYDSI